MKEINNILIVSELNKESYEALAYGITLGLMFEAEMCCMHVLKPSPIDLVKETFLIGSDHYENALKEAKEESQNLLGHIIDIIGQELGVGELNVDLKIVSGPIGKSINEFAKKMNADLVVLGADSGTKFLNSQQTTLALSMIEEGDTNILLIPSGYKMDRIDQIGGFINFEAEDVQFIYKLINLFEQTEFGVRLIHVATNENEAENVDPALRRFEKLFSEPIKSGNICFDVEIGPLTKVLNSLNDNHDIDLMVIRKNRRHWNVFTSVSSFSDKVIRNIKIPLLVWKSSDNKKIPGVYIGSSN